MPGPLLRRSSARYFVRRPWQLLLAVIGIALGVAVVVAVDLATTSARRAFELSSEAVFGRTTHQVLPGPGGLPDSVYRRIRLGLPVPAAPVVETWARVEAGDVARNVRLLGVDPFAESPFRPYLDASSSAIDIAAVMTRPGAVILPEPIAAALGLSPGDSFAITIAGRARAAWLAGELKPQDALSRQALADIALADIATAQELADRTGRLDRIDLRVPGGERPGPGSAGGVLDSIRALLPPGAELVGAAARSTTTASMTRAFELNLAAFALITLLFGALLIYDVMTFAVVQRRELIGLLRAVGVTRREVFALLLGEALALGTLATLLGLGLGAILGNGLVRLVAQTINDLYFAVTVSGITLAPASVAKGVILGIGATLAAAVPPLWEATSTPPRTVLARSSLEHGARRTVRRAAIAGVAMLVPAILLIIVPGRSIVVGFAALFAVVAAAALVAPFATAVLARLLHPLAARAAGTAGSMAVRGVAASLSRTGPAVAALMVAVSVGAAVATMVASFRHSVEQWLDASLQADLYVASPSVGSRGEGTLTPTAIAAVRSLPGLAGISTYRQSDVRYDEAPLRVVAVDLYERHRDAFTFLQGEAATVWPAFAGGSVLVSEAFAYRAGVTVGDTVQLLTDRGTHGFPVAAIFRDYASEFGVLFVERAVHDRFWNDRSISSLALFAAAGVDTDSLRSRLEARIGGTEQLFIRSNRGLREATLEVFDRTFVITGVLRALALLVAFVGVFSALMALQLERGRELAMLRAIGLTPRQIAALVTAQSGLLGLAAGLLAAPVAISLAWLLINVINRRSFGWSVELLTDWAGLLEAIALAALAALLAGGYPAWRMSRTPPAAALRNE